MDGDRILLVEDESACAGNLRVALEAGGYAVIVCPTADAAMAAVRDEEITAAVVSLDLGDVDGAALVAALAERNPEVPCVLLCAPTSVEVLAELYDLGNVFNHGWKPLGEIGDLARSLGRAIERRALKGQNARLLTELRDSRDELRSQTEFMIQTEKLAAMGQLAAGLISAIESPVAQMERSVGMLQLALEGGPRYREKAAACAHFIGDAAASSRRLLDRARQFASGERSGMAPADLHHVLDNALGLVRGMRRASAIKLIVGYAEDLPAIHADTALLEQAFVHVLINAVHAMPDGGVLSVATEELRGAPAGARIRIRDTGVGIEPHVLPNVLNPFYTTHRFGEGTGLGLAVTRSILREHDAELSIDTSTGRGTLVTLTFHATAAIGPEATKSQYQRIAA